MALSEPVAVCSATTNAEAQIRCHILGQSGIEAHPVEDNSLAGLWIGGTVPHIHTPKVWISKADVERAVPILENYDKTRFERDGKIARGTPDQTIVEATCEECGGSSTFWARVMGTVQECPHCGKFMDVGPADGDLDWAAEDEPDSQAETEELS